MKPLSSGSGASPDNPLINKSLSITLRIHRRWPGACSAAIFLCVCVCVCVCVCEAPLVEGTSSTLKENAKKPKKKPSTPHLACTNTDTDSIRSALSVVGNRYVKRGFTHTHTQKYVQRKRKSKPMKKKESMRLGSWLGFVSVGYILPWFLFSSRFSFVSVLVASFGLLVWLAPLLLSLLGFLTNTPILSKWFIHSPSIFFFTTSASHFF